MKYLAYYEVLEGSWFNVSDSLEELKKPWCFTMRIFETNGLTMNEFKKMPKPRFPKVISIYKEIYSEGALMHENEAIEKLEK